MASPFPLSSLPPTSHLQTPPLLNLNKAMSLGMMIIGGFFNGANDFDDADDDGWNMMMMKAT